eukprot:CAMPEP_0182610418 /NCGR_PEP_ID=MMETSP1330-20130603/7885_1 /TAXON_ID=464278 /ORGANISM="Picochlorum sp., Strain RCC944" /LENGTH=133 /DNA_ID=CAMNT_0024829603 /DNA_START=58 /DNA_END=456 /DNA_ORIENTATION=+
MLKQNHSNRLTSATRRAAPQAHASLTTRTKTKKQNISRNTFSTASNKRVITASASGKSEGSFWGGFLVGGTVFGVLGFLFAPQVSRALLNSERMKKLLGDGHENLEITREMLNDKISELNSAIDGVSAQLQSS